MKLIVTKHVKRNQNKIKPKQNTEVQKPDF